MVKVIQKILDFLQNLQIARLHEHFKDIFSQKLPARRGYARSLLCLLCLFSLFSPYSSAYATLSVNPVNENIMINDMMKDWIKRADIPGAVVQIYSNGNPNSYYFGVESLDTHKPVNEKTIFEVGSFTKLFTCLLLAEEMTAKRVNLNDKVTQYLPYLAKYPHSPFTSITLEALATHTSGLPFMVPNKVQTQAELPTYFEHWQPYAPIGSEWQYSNIGTGLLGNALEAETHQSINSLYIERFLKPLGMLPIGIKVPKKLQSYYAQGYDRYGNAVPHAHYAQDYNIEGRALSHFDTSLLPESGAMKMSAADALLFLKAAVGMKKVPEEITEAMKITQTPYVHVSTKQMDQGLGWAIYPLTFPLNPKQLDNLLHLNEKSDRGPLPSTYIPREKQIYNGNALMEKTGLTGGFRTYIGVIPSKKSGIVIMANHYSANTDIIQIGRSILFNLESIKSAH